MAVIVLSPVCWIKHLKNLSWIAVLALCGMVCCLCVILWYDFQYIFHEEEEDKGVKMFDAIHYPLFFGIAILNFEGNPATLNVQASMKHPEKFPFVFVTSAITVSSLVIIVSSLSYLAYGEEVEELITLNLPHNNLTTLIRLVYSIGLIASFPLQMFPNLDIIENFRWYQNLPASESCPVLKFLITRTLVVAFCGLIAVLVPSFGLFLDFLGALAGTVL